jgi:hypothetical protein
MPVQFDTGYSGHVNVGDQAGGIRQVSDARKSAADANASTV